MNIGLNSPQMYVIFIPFSFFFFRLPEFLICDELNVASIVMVFTIVLSTTNLWYDGSH